MSTTNEDDKHGQYGIEELRAEVVEQQKAVLWEDTLKRGRSVDAFLWRGDMKAKPVQRAGLIIFACMFLLLAVAFGSVPFQKHFEYGWPIEFLFAIGLFLISARLFRNAFLRDKTPRIALDDHDND